jgi:hypothetical protein
MSPISQSFRHRQAFPVNCNVTLAYWTHSQVRKFANAAPERFGLFYDQVDFLVVDLFSPRNQP